MENKKGAFCMAAGFLLVLAALLLTGYNVETVTFVDPDNGTERTVARDEMERMVAAGGNTFIGFVK